MPLDPWKDLSAAEMEQMRLNDPEEFAKRAALLDKPSSTQKTIVYRNGQLVDGPVPSKGD
jgi:hypothetical protein